MKREIKFRGKRIDNGEWVYGYFSGDCEITAETKDESCGFNTSDAYDIIQGTIGQFTGLLDKNGREIYEGDILTIDSISANTHVMFIDGCFWLNYDEKDNEQILPLYSETKFNVWKVIGNIHDEKKRKGEL